MGLLLVGVFLQPPEIISVPFLLSRHWHGGARQHPLQNGQMEELQPVPFALGVMQFKVTASRYDPAAQRLHFTASGERMGIRFTVASHVRCLKDPGTPDRVHLVALVALTDIFKRPSASGR
jgi:hypothetical protein